MKKDKGSRSPQRTFLPLAHQNSTFRFSAPIFSLARLTSNSLYIAIVALFTTANTMNQGDNQLPMWQGDVDWSLMEDDWASG
jgi:hypothetical protein